MSRTVRLPGYGRECAARGWTDTDVSALEGLSENTLSKVARGDAVSVQVAKRLFALFEAHPVSPAARALLAVEKDAAATGPGE